MAKPLKNLVQNHLGNVAIIMDGNGRWAKKNALNNLCIDHHLSKNVLMVTTTFSKSLFKILVEHGIERAEP